MIDFKYDGGSGKLHLIDTGSLDSYVLDILKEGFDLGDNTIYLRPTYIDMDENPIKKSGTITFGSSEDTNLYRSAADVLKTDDSFDASALLVGGSEIVTSGRVLQNIASVAQSLIPSSDNTHDLGSSTYRWRDIHAVNFYGTAHYADVYFQDLECPVCHKQFKTGDKVALIVLDVDKEIRCLPVHLRCEWHGLHLE